MTPAAAAHRDEFLEVAEVEAVVTEATGDSGRAAVALTGVHSGHELIGRLRAAGRPGLVLFSSGSTGKSKAALHDFVPLLDKYRAGGRATTMLAFLLFDHIGGVNTMLHSLASGGCLVTVDRRSPDRVAAAIERWAVEALPTSP